VPEAPRYVVDASTEVKWYREDEPQAQESLVFLTDYHRGKVSLLAPDQIRYEVPAAMRRAVIRNRLSREDGRLLAY
jgi:predicted nucleic acid-binding protein